MKSFIAVLLIIPYAFLFTGQKDSSGTFLKELSFSAEIDFCSSYLYKGVVYSEGFVVQPSLRAAYKDLTLGAWWNTNPYLKEDQAAVSEFDLSLYHTFETGNLSITNTVAVYFYYGTDAYPTTAEYILFASYSLESFGFQNDLSVDFIDNPGALIVTHGISYTVDLTPWLQFGSAANLSWANGLYNEVNIGLRKSALNYIGIDLAFTINTSSGFYIKPHYQYNVVTDRELQDYIGKQNSSFGVLSGYNF